MKDIERVDWNKYKITIIMANYNKEEYIKQAIESVLMQESRFNYILTIIDDCSQDSSPVIIESYEKQYPDNILVIRSEKNEGYFKSQLKVYRDMRTEYYTLLDPDDFWTYKYVLEEAVSFLESHADFMACGFNTQIIKAGKIQEQLFCPIHNSEMSYERIEDYFDGKCVMPHTSATFYRNAIYKNGVPDLFLKASDSLAEASFRGDTDRFVLQLKYGKIKFINKVVSIYRIYEGGIWSGASFITQRLMNSRAQLDYSDFYDKKYEREFMRLIKSDKVRIINDIIGTKYICREKDKQKDMENYYYIMRRLICISELSISEEDIEIIWKFINEYDGEPVIIWGCGGTAEILLKRYLFKDIKYFIDSDTRKQGQKFHDICIKSPAEIEDGFYIIIMSMYYNQIKDTIKQNDLCNIDRVLNLYGYDKL